MFGLKFIGMNTKVSITAFLLFFAFCASAQNMDFDGWIDGWRGLSERSNRNINSKGNTSNSDFQRNRRTNRQRTVAASTEWKRGKVLLSDSSLKEGLVSYNIAKDIVQVDSGDSLQIFSANQIWNFEVYEDLSQVKRNSDGLKVELKTKRTWYFSLPYAEKNGYLRPKIFELVVIGNTSLLRRWAHGTARYDRKLYLINDEGKITQIKKRRGSVIKAFDGKHEELKKIAREERLDMYVLGDVIRLVEAYNQLSDQ
ncbi:MAG: hypothetical protein ACJAVN_002879 [Roseivirga sp.]|jgi:hypothetical protein